LLGDTNSRNETAMEDLLTWYEEQDYLEQLANRATIFMWNIVKAYEKVGFPKLEMRNEWTTWNLLDDTYNTAQPDDNATAAARRLLLHLQCCSRVSFNQVLERCWNCYPESFEII